jgi:peptidoglycan/xylan/chitin deacetylase (PgdA/CDA1 family)
MYHNVVETDAARDAFPADHRKYVTSRPVFEAHVDCLLAGGAKFLTPAEFSERETLAKTDVLLTFDDSWENDAALAVLDRIGVKGIFFLNSTDVDRAGMVSSERVAALAAEGHEIGSHGVRHTFFTRVADPDLETELRSSREALEGLTGRKVRFLSAPGGRYDARVVKAARGCGYKALFTSRPGRLAPPSTRFVLNRIAVTADISGKRLARLLAAPAVAILRRRLRYYLASGTRVARVLFPGRAGG